MKISKVCAIGLIVVPLLGVQGCATTSAWLPASGPSAGDITDAGKQPNSAIKVVYVDDTVIQTLAEERKHTYFSQQFPAKLGATYLVGPGDVLAISLWEAPPSTLFTSAPLDGMGGATTRMVSFPEQMVSANGTIDIPFAGMIHVAGRSPQQIQTMIEKKLSGKAHDPQVLVRMAQNTTATVTIVGDVGRSLQMPLTAKGDRLLDALAAAGGVRQSVGKETIQLARDGHVVSMPLKHVIQDPSQNVPLAPGDVITVTPKPLSLIVLGATVKNEEMYFESQGISLAQALGRAGGLQDARADARGVFVFRMADETDLGTTAAKPESKSATKDGKVPVVYVLDMRNPGSLLLAQGFKMHDNDVLYVSNAPAAELQKFLNIVTSSVYSITSLKAIGN
ncbi:polysaccharide biosynthesis/export family protein [Halothiobacillus diazotrophicus]|uniref:polysaccharide biosynthesis/export family protein n=1 Tax=Halothiobacillus diazotrophicus TaxID=1860122 RepID=UPI0009ED096E|nr:polysaccharide biosynthesis/export family protein [Halothiobacillus diazotrophicus]